MGCDGDKSLTKRTRIRKLLCKTQIDKEGGLLGQQHKLQSCSVKQGRSVKWTPSVVISAGGNICTYT